VARGNLREDCGRNERGGKGDMIILLFVMGFQIGAYPSWAECERHAVMFVDGICRERPVIRQPSK
jgi:hypothetical protein